MTTDAFTEGSDGVALATHDSNWTAGSNVGNMEINSNKCENTGDWSAAGYAYYDGSQEDYSEITLLSNTGSPSGNPQPRACVRMGHTSASDLGYSVRIYGSTTQWTSLELRADGNYLTTATITSAIDKATGCTLSIECVDNGGNVDITVKVDGVTEISYSHTSGTLSGGYDGFLVFGGGSAASGAVDEWTNGAGGGATTHEASISVALSAGATHASSAVLEGGISVGLSAGASDGANATYESSLSQGLTAGFTTSANCVFEESITVDVQVTDSLAGGSFLDASIPVDLSIGFTPNGGLAIEAAATIGLQVSGSMDSDISLEGSITSALEADAVVVSSMIAEASIVNGVILSSSNVTTKVAVATISETINLDAGISANAILETNIAEGVTLGQLLTGIAQAVYSNGAPADRTFIVQADGRTMTVHRDDRTLTIEADGRTYTVKTRKS